MSRGCNRGDCGGVWRVVVDAVARWILGGVLLFSGAVKSVDPVGTSLYVDKYLATYSLEALLPLSVTIAVVLAVAEFALGVLLILGYHRRVTIAFTLILTSIFFVVTLLSATLLPIGDCGCFGPMLRLEPWQSLAKNVVLLSLAILLYLNLRSRSAERYGVTGVVAIIVAIALPMAANLYSLRYLPIVDFMSYKVGTQLGAKVTEERAAEQEGARYTLRFRRLDTGQIVEFDASASEYWHDANLEYLDSVATDKVVDAEYSDFRLYGADGEDYSLDVLGRKGRVALLCVNRCASVDDKSIGGIERLLASYPRSGIVVLKACDYELDLIDDMETYRVDAQTLRNVVRADIGVVVLRDGVVEFKADIRDI